jgi:hypothetical protein
MAISITSAGIPTTTGFTANATPEQVTLNISSMRKYLMIINNSTNEIEVAFGSTPADADYIKIGANGAFEPAHDAFFNIVDYMTMWVKAATDSDVIIVH